MDFKMPSQSTQLHQCHRRNLQSDNAYTRQTNQSTDEKKIQRRRRTHYWKRTLWCATQIRNKSHSESCGPGVDVRNLLRWYGYSQADDTNEWPAHIPERLITCYWRQMKNTDAVRKQCGRAHARKRRKVLKKPTLTNDDNAKDGISSEGQWLGWSQSSAAEIIKGNWWAGLFCRTNRLRVLCMQI